MDRGKFSWVIQDSLAGCPSPNNSDLEFLRLKEIKHVVRLAEANKAFVTPNQVRAAGLDDLHVPIPDFQAPLPEQIALICSKVDSWMDLREATVVSCGQGIGRTGTILACILLSRCNSYDEAVNLVRKRNRDCYNQDLAWETPQQGQAVKNFAVSLGKSS